MVKKRILKDNCYRVVAGVMQKIPVGEIVECSENAYGSKAELVEERKMEVATPKRRQNRKRGEKDGQD